MDGCSLRPKVEGAGESVEHLSPSHGPEVSEKPEQGKRQGVGGLQGEVVEVLPASLSKLAWEVVG